jgi:ribosomal-protein-alanine N-acetyltransferase
MILTTERLVLREFVVEDWPAVLAYQQKPQYLRYYEWNGRTSEDVQEFVRRQVGQQQVVPRIKFQLVITLKSTGQLIGNCGIRLESAGAHEADIGYELDPDHWGQGYATEAARAMVRFGFTQLHLQRIWAQHVADNHGSGRVLQKLGMQLEGRLRETQFYKGQWWDTVLYAILEHEWQTQQS